MTQYTHATEENEKYPSRAPICDDAASQGLAPRLGIPSAEGGQADARQ